MKYLILFVMMSISNTWSFHCEEIAKQTTRTQGGGWIWFPGKAEFTNRDKAIAYAKAKAILNYTEECGPVIHRAAKFNEVCIQESSFVESFFGAGTVYKITARLAITDKECKQARRAYRENNEVLVEEIANMELLDLLQDIKKGRY